MNKYMKKWIAALRSREYNQATGSLERFGGYCCLGVACKMLAKEKGCGPTKFSFARDNLKFVGSLNKGTLKLLGIDKEVEQELITLNDSKRYSFKKIANFLEKKYK